MYYVEYRELIWMIYQNSNHAYLSYRNIKELALKRGLKVESR